MKTEVRELSTEQLDAELRYVKQMLQRGVAGKKYAKQVATRFHDLWDENARRQQIELNADKGLKV